MPGADANPYLAFAASLACGYLGMVERLKPSEPVEGSAYRYAHTLPINLEEALDKLTYTKSFKLVLGEKFVEAYRDVKNEEMQHYRPVIRSWEREYLLTSPLSTHELSFAQPALTDEAKGEGVEILSIFIYSPVSATTLNQFPHLRLVTSED